MQAKRKRLLKNCFILLKKLCYFRSLRGVAWSNGQRRSLLLQGSAVCALVSSTFYHSFLAAMTATFSRWRPERRMANCESRLCPLCEEVTGASAKARGRGEGERRRDRQSKVELSIRTKKDGSEEIWLNGQCHLVKNVEILQDNYQIQNIEFIQYMLTL